MGKHRAHDLNQEWFRCATDVVKCCIAVRLLVQLAVSGAMAELNRVEASGSFRSFGHERSEAWEAANTAFAQAGADLREADESIRAAILEWNAAYRAFVTGPCSQEL